MKRSYFGGFVLPRIMQIKEASSIIASELISGNFPIVILVAGGSASGKTTFANKLVERLSKLSFDVILISMDDYYIGREYSEKHGYNFDQPESIDILMLKRHLNDLKKGESINKPIYSFIEEGGKRVGYEKINPRQIIVVEGLFALDKKLTNAGDLKIFVKTNCHGRFVRRIMRDSKRTVWNQKDILSYFLSVVEPMHISYIDSQEDVADIVVNNPYDPVIETTQAGCNKEKQIKVILDNPKSIEEFQKAGAEFLAHTIQEDHYFVGFGQLEGEVVRIRREQNNLIFTYKAPEIKNEMRIKHKFEFPISEQEKEKIEKAFKEKTTIIKIRDIFVLNKIVFSLDRIVLKGKDLYFLEIRGNNIKEAKNLLKKLDISGELTRKSYFEIFS